MGGWQIVKFPEDDNKVEAVPSSWISKEQGKIMCFWPNTISSSKVLNYIKSQAQPQGDWKSYPVVILTQYPEESYSFACQKAKRAQYTSAVDTGEESEEDRISKRKRKKNHKYLSSESEDSPLKTARKTSRQLNKMPTPPDQTKVASSSSQIALNNVSKNLGNVLESVAENTDSGQNKDVRTTSSRNQNLTKTSCERCKDLKEVLRLLNLINARVSNNLEEIKALQSGTSSNSNAKVVQPEANIDIGTLPATNEHEFRELSNKMNDKSIREYMVNKLVHIGGTTIKEIVKRCMSSIVDEKSLSLTVGLEERAN
ncbi:unnamed protein product [Ceutorhynchus assimilis]|uniref:DUF4806 domain-containing protein n=1 Tax=Ceutorhynchus assimilis TaxID=467358 RepID=A0A9N9MPW2_9CUCU|nr:unnamed protein product [Ceutorhynchus assimilis]